MIPIKRIGDLSDFRLKIKDIRNKLAKTIDNGYPGNRKSLSWRKINKYYRSLDATTRKRFLKSVGKGFLQYEVCKKELKELNGIKAPEYVLTDSEQSVVKELLDNLEKITEAPYDDLKTWIDRFQREFNPDRDGNPRKESALYKAVYKIFVTQGYEDDEFKDTVWKITDLRVCPYCNRSYISLIYITRSSKTLRGQLDHFYPKEKYPYLAMSVFNLVPSCSFCNGINGKSSRDPYIEGIISPYSLSDHKGLRFRLGSFSNKIFDLEKCARDIEIIADVSQNPAMAKNEEVFNLVDMYTAHRDLAADIIFKHRIISSKPYLDSIINLLRNPDLQVNGKDLMLLFWGVPLSEDRLGERPMSKFTLDLINHLEESKGF